MGCLGRIFVLVLLLGVIAFAWMRGPEILDRFQGGDEAATGEEGDQQGDAALAAAVVARFRQAVEEDSGTVSFTGREVEALLRHHLAGRLPKGGVEPSVSISDGEVRLSAKFPRDSIPLPPELEAGRRLLPRRLPVEVTGVIFSTESGTVLVVRRVEVVGIGVPRRISNRLMDHLRGEADEGLPVSTLPVPLPPEVPGAYIDGDRLVLGELP